MPRQRHRYLYRSDVRHRTDKPTNSIILQYVGGRRLQWHDRIYGYDDGTFFVCNVDEIGYPPQLEELARELGIDIDLLPGSRSIREAAAEALAAEGLVDAPELLHDLATPEVKWRSWDERELERKHMIAVARLTELTRIMAAEMRRRCLPTCAPLAEPVVVAALPPVAGVEYGSAPEPGHILSPAVAESPTEPPVMVEEEVDEDIVEAETLTASSTVVKRTRFAVETAREAELPQRLPAGARRRLRQMPPGVYLAYGEALDIRSELCAAMTDGRALGRKGREVALIDWDGEWPVVARRYGQGGRTVYKVEDALRRHGIEVKSDAA